MVSRSDIRRRTNLYFRSKSKQRQQQERLERLLKANPGMSKKTAEGLCGKAEL